MRKFRLLLAAALATLLTACAGWTPPPAGSSTQPSSPAGSGTSSPASATTPGSAAPQRSDAPAGAGVQVFPMQNPAVKDLLADASSAESVGDYNKAASLLERALRIEPRDPEILQDMAEVQLKNRDYNQALNFAIRSYDSGPRTGELCSRNWQTIGEARGQLGDRSGADEAKQRAGQCLEPRAGNY